MKKIIIIFLFLLFQNFTSQAIDFDEIKRRTIGDKNAKIIIITHVGRPKGRKVIELSLKPICEYLKNRI